MKFQDNLIKIEACREAVKWVNGKGFKKSWATCERGDWMAWYIGRNKDKFGLSDMRLITLAKVKTANLVKHLMKDKRSLKALKVAENFANGIATREELDNAAAAAAEAAASAAAVYAASAAAVYAAVYAAEAAAEAAAVYAASASAVYAAVYAAEAAAVYAAADAAEAAAAIKKIRSQIADIYREVFKDIKLS